MLIFIFAALVVVVDQLFKRWITLTLADGGQITLIPGVLGLTYAENTGAAFGIFASMRWPLVIITASLLIILIVILRRYNGGFWGSLSLAAGLGGGIGNLIDRVLNGYVVDMFELYFVNFAIFNVADIFITLGFITFAVHFIATSGKSKEPEQIPDQGQGQKQWQWEPEPPEGVDEEFDFSVDLYAGYDTDYADDPELGLSADTRPLPTGDWSQPDVSDWGRPEVSEWSQPEAQDLTQPEEEDFSAIITDIEYSTSDPAELEISETSILEEYDMERLFAEYNLEDDEY